MTETERKAALIKIYGYGYGKGTSIKILEKYPYMFIYYIWEIITMKYHGLVLKREMHASISLVRFLRMRLFGFFVIFRFNE